MGDCVICEEQITNPLGPQRLQEQVATWLHESRPELISDFFEASQEIMPLEETGDDFCIVKGNKMNICAYCYTEHILKWLLSTRPDWNTINEYFTYFDYDGEHQGYSKTIEAKGYVL